MAKFRILSLDGGGIRGLFTAVLLDRLNTAVPGFLDGVSLFAGTSTGGILALGLAAGLTPSQCAELYSKNGRLVFDDSAFDNLFDLGNAVGAQYSNENLKRLLADQFKSRGVTTLGDLRAKVVVSSFDLDNQDEISLQQKKAKDREKDDFRAWKPKFFHNFPGDDTDAGQLAVDVALRTSAAPTYFPVYQGYIDGGVAANNPGMCAVAQALTSKVDLNDMVLLSVSTGRNSRFLKDVQSKNWGWVQWAKPMLNLMLDANVGVADYQCQRVLQDNYYRLDPLLRDPNAPFGERDLDISLDDWKQAGLLERLAGKVDLTEALQWLRSHWLTDVAEAGSSPAPVPFSVPANQPRPGSKPKAKPKAKPRAASSRRRK